MQKVFKLPAMTYQINTSFYRPISSLYPPTLTQAPTNLAQNSKMPVYEIALNAVSQAYLENSAILNPALDWLSKRPGFIQFVATLVPFLITD